MYLCRKEVTPLTNTYKISIKQYPNSYKTNKFNSLDEPLRKFTLEFMQRAPKFVIGKHPYEIAQAFMDRIDPTLWSMNSFSNLFKLILDTNELGVVPKRIKDGARYLIWVLDHGKAVIQEEENKLRNINEKNKKHDTSVTRLSDLQYVDDEERARWIAINDDADPVMIKISTQETEEAKKKWELENTRKIERNKEIEQKALLEEEELDFVMQLEANKILYGEAGEVLLLWDMYTHLWFQKQLHLIADEDFERKMLTLAIKFDEAYKRTPEFRNYETLMVYKDVAEKNPLIFTETEDNYHAEELPTVSQEMISEQRNKMIKYAYEQLDELRKTGEDTSAIIKHIESLEAETK